MHCPFTVDANTWQEWSIPHEDVFPDYEQHVCCGCISGCTPVAWAQIFAYYDRLAHFSFTSYGHNKGLFRCGGTRSGSSYCVAPDEMDSSVETFVEDIRETLGTYCDNGAGSTYTTNNIRINAWYRSRQGYSATVEHYPSWMRRGKRSSTVGSVTVYSYESEARNKAIEALKGNPAYPVRVTIDVASNGGKKGGHSAVVTKYREKWRKYRKRHCRKVGWWWGRRTRCEDIWSTQDDRKFYFRMEWDGYGKAWHTALAETASIAKPY